VGVNYFILNPHVECKGELNALAQPLRALWQTPCRGFRTSELDPETKEFSKVPFTMLCFSQRRHKSAQLTLSEASPAACSVGYQDSYSK